MPGLHLDQLRVSRRRRHPFDSRLWREWCFLRAVFKHFRVLLVVMFVLLFGGALAFMWLEEEKHHSLSRGLYFTWSLIFGEPPEAFPSHPVLQTLFFLVPIVGLIVVIEGILEFAFILRDRRRSERSWCQTMAQSMSNHIVLIGMGRLGFRTFLLLRKLGEAVVVIERDESNQFLEEVRRDGSPLFLCDARREAILEDVNIARARSIVLATDDDLANLEIALDARHFNPDIRVVLRMFDQNMADKIRHGFDIHIAMSQAAISAPMFAMSAIEPSITSSQVVEGELLVTQRWRVKRDGPLCGLTVCDVLDRLRLAIVERRSRRGDAELFPSSTTRLEEGDELVMHGAYDRLLDLPGQAIHPRMRSDAGRDVAK